MNRLLVGLMVALLMVTATATSASAAPRDFVSGSGKFNFGVGIGAGHASFTGHGGPRHNNGVIRLKVPGTIPVSMNATVDCISVDGNSAAISGTLKKPTETGLKYVLLYVEDNGKPQGKTDRAFGKLSTSPFECAAPLIGTASNITQGNVVVKDKTP